jgi:Flp pilus assembly secretin CpaC
MSKVEHLREAARHLDAAGYLEQSQQLQHEAKELMESAATLLTQKRAALETLQHEITALEESIGEHQQIMLRCRIVEIDRTRMEQEGFGFLLVEPISAKRLSTPELDGLIGALQRKGMAKVLAEPTIVTTNGRPASLRSGGEIPVIQPASGDTSSRSVDWHETGFRIEAVPVCLGGDRLRLELAVELATADFKHTAVVTAGDNVYPIMDITSANTQIEMHFGETKVIGAMITRRDPRPPREGEAADEGNARDAQETELVVIVTAEAARKVRATSEGDHKPAAVPMPR